MNRHTSIARMLVLSACLVGGLLELVALQKARMFGRLR